MNNLARRSSSIILLTLSICLLISCGRDFTITRNEIYDPAWEKGGYQAFTIAKIHLNKSNISVFNKDFNRFDLSDYKVDSTFCFHPTPLKKGISTVGTIYFNQENDVFSEWFNCGDFYDRKRTIGSLEFNNWYVIQDLGGTIDYFVFIDESGQAHHYSLGPTNW